MIGVTVHYLYLGGGCGGRHVVLLYLEQVGVCRGHRAPADLQAEEG